jgi:hypothetical protein
MTRTAALCVSFLLLILCVTPAAYGELMRGGATLSSVSSVIKISLEGNGLGSLVPGEILYVFTEYGEPVSQIFVKDVFSDVIHSEPLPDAVARQIRETRSILIFSNLREYGDFIIAFRTGTVESFGDFIARNRESELREEAQRIYDGIVFRPFKLKDTPGAFGDFIKQHPDNYYVDSALKRRDDLRYIPAREAGKVSQYRLFISTYPGNRNLEEARARIKAILSTYEDTALEEVAKYPRSHLGKSVKFASTLHSALPVYVEGPGVGRKAAHFKSPRNAVDHLNFQVTENEFVLWRLFAARENEDLVKRIQGFEKGDNIIVYGVVFDILGGAPWIDVDDIERY